MSLSACEFVLHVFVFVYMSVHACPQNERAENCCRLEEKAIKQQLKLTDEWTAAKHSNKKNLRLKFLSEKEREN